MKRSLPGAQLVLDATGVGRPIVDMLEERRLMDIVPISITAGERFHSVGGWWRVPKRDPVGVVQRVLQERRIRIASALPAAQTLVTELLNFRVKISPSAGNDSYGAWRERDHDDLVLALAVALWYAERNGATDPEDWPTMRV